MTVRRLAACLTLFLCFVASEARAYETWPAEVSTLRLTADAYTSFASSQYQHTGDTLQLLDEHTPGSLQAVGLALDVEYGLFPDVALFAQTAVQNVRLEAETTSAAVAGMSDLMLGSKWAVLDDAFSLTLAPAVKFPTGYSADPGPFVPSLGNGVNEYEARVWAGKRFTDVPFYLELGLGYRIRGTRVPRGGGPKLIYADEIPYDIELAFDPVAKVRAYGLLDGVYGLGKPAVVERVTLQPLTEDFIRIGAGVGYGVAEALRVLATYRVTVAGVNAIKSQMLTLGVIVDVGGSS